MTDSTDGLDRAKRAITEDIEAGRVPADVSSLDELGQFVDVTRYLGGLDDTEALRGDGDVHSETSAALGAWMANGRPASS